MQTYTDLATAAYSPRKLYYPLREGHSDVPDEVEAVGRLARRYESLLDAGTELDDEPIAIMPTQYCSNLGSAKARLDVWQDLADPSAHERGAGGNELQ